VAQAGQKVRFTTAADLMLLLESAHRQGRVKWECVYLREFETGSQTHQALGNWFRFDNEQRPHTTFDGLTCPGLFGPSET